MVYKNFKIRFFIGIILISLFILSLFNHKVLISFSSIIYLIIVVEVFYNFNKLKYIIYL
jgi:hypothetical protein